MALKLRRLYLKRIQNEMGASEGFLDMEFGMTHFVPSENNIVECM